MNRVIPIWFCFPLAAIALWAGFVLPNMVAQVIEWARHLHP